MRETDRVEIRLMNIGHVREVLRLDLSLQPLQISQFKGRKKVRRPSPEPEQDLKLEIATILLPTCRPTRACLVNEQIEDRCAEQQQDLSQF